MTDAVFRELVEAAAHPYRRSGRYAWHFAQGKLRRRSGVPFPAAQRRAAFRRRACWTWDADREC